MSARRRDSDLVRPYVVTGGRAHARGRFDLVSLVVAVGEVSTPSPGPDSSPEKRHLLAMCRGGALSVAELAAHLGLPSTVTKVLLGDLADAGYITTRAPAPPAHSPDPELLKEVLDGLRARL